MESVGTTGCIPDISRNIKKLDLVFDLKVNKAQNFTISFEDYTGKKLSYQIDKNDIKKDNKWNKVQIPLYRFPIRKSNVDLTKIKQIHFAFNYNTEISIDNIKLIKIKTMKNIFTFLFFITTPFFMSSQVLWDDFEQNRVGYYEFVHGGMTTRYANPDVNNSVNTSPICAQYVRNPGELWDVLVIVGNGPIDDVSSYVDGTKTMSVDVYSPAPGIPVQITLEDSSLAGPTNYPVGRHSIYLGVTTTTNQWETVNLTFDSQPDAAMSDVGLTSVILLFNGEQILVIYIILTIYMALNSAINVMV